MRLIKDGWIFIYREEVKKDINMYYGKILQFDNDSLQNCSMENLEYENIVEEFFMTQLYEKYHILGFIESFS